MNESNKLEKENFYRITSQLIDSKKKLLEEMEDLEKYKSLIFKEKYYNNNNEENPFNYFDNDNYNDNLIDINNYNDNDLIKSNYNYNFNSSLPLGINNPNNNSNNNNNKNQNLPPRRERNFLNIRGNSNNRVKGNLNNSMQNDEKITLRVIDFNDNVNAVGNNKSLRNNSPLYEKNNPNSNSNSNSITNRPPSGNNFGLRK
jgi:hypothetical protein